MGSQTRAGWLGARAASEFLKRAGLIAALCAALAAYATLPAIAQSTVPVPKEFETVDFNGVALGDGGATFRMPEPALSIGDPSHGGLTWQRFHGAPFDSGAAIERSNKDFWVTANNSNTLWGQYALCGDLVQSYSFAVGQSVETFSLKFLPPSSTAYGSTQYSGGIVSTANGEVAYTKSDGTVVTYTPMGANPACGNNGSWGRIKSLAKPDGEVITWNYYVMPSGAYAGSWRVQSVTNNLNYQIHFQYQRDTATTAGERDTWYQIQKVTAVDNAINPCGALALSCSDSSGANWPYLTYGYESGPAGANSVQTVTDRLGNVSRFSYSGNLMVTPNGGYHFTGYRAPSGGADDISFAYAPFRLTKAGVTWTYTFGSVSASVSGPNGYARTVTFTSQQPTDPLMLETRAPMPETDTLNGRTTTYTYEFSPDNVGVRLIRVTGHDGDYAEYEYAQGRRNVTHVRQVAKPGSGLADVHAYASYPEPAGEFCSNIKTCNKPVWVTVPGAASGTPSSLPKTDFTYDATHGGLLTETKPAPGSGPFAAIRPQTRTTYAAVGGVTRVASVKSCRTAATCAGTADETVVETTYNTKRLPSLIVTRAGNNTTAFTATNTRVAMAYSPQGDVESADGPLSGAVDTAWTFYDTMRRPRVTVAPDPDGAGTLVYRASRTTYDADGQPVMAEQGSVSAPANCSAANNFCATTMTVLAKSTIEYDVYGRKTRENAYGSASTPQSVVQYSYDIAGRVECVATRMNSAVYGSLPAACTQTTAGSFGADPILRTTYTANGDPSVIQSGYGTTLVRNERTFTYLAPGQVATLKDAANNLTTYAYDGFNRLNKLSYPNTAVGAGTSSATDYEAYTYDAADNRVSERRRDGLMIANTYDALNRLRLIDKPGVELDVTNSYDNFDHLVTASQTGSSVTWAYDPLGRVTSEAQALGTVSYTYDTASRRTQLTYPGAGFFANYQYFDDGRLKLIGLNGATTGTGVLATYYDDQLGRRTSMCRGTGTTSSCSTVARTTYSYDAASRLSGLAHDLITGTSANDASWTLAYSPASQLTSRTATSALYEWPYSATFTDAYAVNGLNQYTTVAGASLAYDGRGNTTNDTTKTYTYDSSNMLTSASNGAALTYDPTGRLLSVAQGGVTTKFLYDGTRLIAEYNGSNTLLRRYVHGDGVDDPIVWYDSSGTTNKRNLFKDERGSVIAVDTGTAVTSLKYDEYGNATVTGSTTPRFQYTGQAWLSEIGLNYYKARIYNPDLGRFMQTDPIGTKDQINLYAYVGNDPFNKTDPSGLDIVCGTVNCMIRSDTYDPAHSTGQTTTATWEQRGAAVNAVAAMTVADGADESVGFGVKSADGIVEVQPASGVTTGSTATGSTASVGVPSGAEFLIHGHIDGGPNQSNGMVDDPPSNGGFGDTQTLALSNPIPTATVSQGMVGWHEIVDGRLTFTAPYAAMSDAQRNLIQQNINSTQLLPKFWKP